MAAESKTGMAVPEMRKLLGNAHPDKPLKCAVGISEDGLGLLVVDKIKQPRALEAEMKKNFPGTKVIRFGFATFDLEHDNQLNLALNKLAPGIGKRLIKTLKGTGFNKVHVLAKDENGNDVAEHTSEEEPEEAAAAPRAKAPEADAPAPAASPAVAAASEAPKPAVAAPPPVTPPAPPRAPVAAETPRPAAAAPPPPKPAMAQPAAPAAKAAPNADKAAVKPDAAKSPRSPATVQKAQLAWLATLKRFEADVDKLLAEMNAVYKDHGFAAELDKVFKTKIEPVFAKFDKELVTDLDHVIKASDHEQQTIFVKSAHKRVKAYDAYLKSEPMLAKLDNNPFVKIGLVQTATQSLAVLDKALTAML